MPVRGEDLPAHVRERIAGLVGDQGLSGDNSVGSFYQRRTGQLCPYRCRTCGFELDWSAKGTPATVVAHERETGHHTYEQVLSTRGSHDSPATA